MDVTVEVVEEVVPRARELKESLEAAGVKVLLVHGQFDVAKKLSELLGVPVILAAHLRFQNIPPDTHIVLVDGDLVTDWEAKCLDELKFQCTLLAPPASELVAGTAPMTLRQALRPPLDIFGRHYTDEPPRTYGCHHKRLKCGNCEDLVNRWIAQKRYS